MEWQNRELDLKAVARLYMEKPGEWLLLEVLDTDAEGEPVKLQLHAHSHQKEDLHEYLLEDEHWDWQKKYMIILADPDRPCRI